MDNFEQDRLFFEQEFDYVIENGTVIDPKTELRTIAHVAIKGNKIAGLTRAPLRAKNKIDARGKIVCPGIVDPHSHADGQVFSAQVMASMGVTTIVVGSCGLGPHPSGQFLDKLEEEGYPINCGTLTPESWILREKVGLEGPFGVASDRQIAQILELAERDLSEGSLGISLGLEYAPKTEWKEIIAMASLAAKYDKVVPVHSRAGGWMGLMAAREIIKMQEETGARVLISHHTYQCGQGMLQESLATIEKAYRQGYKIAVDSGAYNAFACPIGSEVFCEGWRDIYDCDYSSLVVGTGPHVGKRLTEKLFNEIVAQDPMTSVTAFVGKPHEVVLTLQQPYVMASTDGGWADLQPGTGHPQTAGTYPKIFGRFVREQNALSMMEAVKKCTWMPAEFLGITNKGWLGAGADADILIFDPATIIDTADYIGLGDPLAKPIGIEYVFVNGYPLIEKGDLDVKARPGKTIRQPNRMWRL